MTNQKYNNQTNEEYNRERFKKRTRKNLDEQVAIMERASNHYKYDPDKFIEQIDWIKDKFYRTTGSANKTILIMRQRQDAKDDIPTNMEASYEAFLNYFEEEDIDPIIDDHFQKLIPVVSSQVYNPKTKAKYFTAEGAKFANSYQPPLYKFTVHENKRPELWQDYLDRLMPRNEICMIGNLKLPQQKFFEQWIIQRIKHPSEPIEINLILRGDQGTGKNFWCDVLLKEILGKTNVYTGSTKDLKSEFKKQIYQSLLFHIEEFDDRRGKLNEILKAITTQKDPYIGDKFLAKTQMQKYFSIAISTNAKYPLTLEQGDRRNFVACFSEHRINKNETDKFFEKFLYWLKHLGGFQKMYNYFQSTPIELDFTTCPITNAKIELTERETYLQSVENDLILWLQDPHCRRCAFSPDELAKKYKLAKTGIQNCLRMAGFVSKQRRWKLDERSKGHTMRLWITRETEDAKNYKNLYLFKHEMEDDLIY